MNALSSQIPDRHPWHPRSPRTASGFHLGRSLSVSPTHAPLCSLPGLTLVLTPVDHGTSLNSRRRQLQSHGKNTAKKDKILALQGHYGLIQNVSKETFERDFEKSCNRNTGRPLALQRRDAQQSRATVTTAEMLFLSIPPQPPPTWRLHVLKNVR